MKMYTFLIHSQEQVHSSHAYSSQDLLNPKTWNASIAMKYIAMK